MMRPVDHPNEKDSPGTSSHIRPRPAISGTLTVEPSTDLAASASRSVNVFICDYLLSPDPSSAKSSAPPKATASIESPESFLKRLIERPGIYSLNPCSPIFFPDSLDDNDPQTFHSAVSTEDGAFEEVEVAPADDERIETILSTITHPQRLCAEQLTIDCDGILEEYGLPKADETERVTEALSTRVDWNDVEALRKKIKVLLRSLDISFAAEFGFSPYRTQKELLRPVYTIYRIIKVASGLGPEGLKQCHTQMVREAIDDVLPGPDTIPSIDESNKSNEDSTRETPSDHLRVSNVEWTGTLRLSELPLRDLSTLSTEELVEWRSKLKGDLVTFGQKFLEVKGRTVKYRADIEEIDPLYTAYRANGKELHKRGETIKRNSSRRDHRLSLDGPMGNKKY